MSGNAKLTEDKVRLIRRLRRCGSTLTEISRVVGVHYSTVSSVCLRKIWSHVEDEAT